MFSLKFVKNFHKEIIENTGGSLGIRDENILESSLKVPFQTFGNEELFSTPIEKASKLLELIIKNHPFVDGNKRTGYVLFRLFLEINGFKITATEEEKYKFIMDIAYRNIKYQEILKWTEKHTKSSI